MNIKEIKLKNFRNHEDYEVELEKVTLFTGPNGSGKSSIVQAVAAALINETVWTANDGVKMRNHIRKGAKFAKITLVAKREITRTIRASGTVLTMADGETITQSMVYKKLGVSHQHLRACLIPQAFLTLKLKEQKDVLFDLLSAEMTLKEVRKHIPKDAGAVWKKIVDRWRKEHQDEPTVDLDKLLAFVMEERKKFKAKISKVVADDSSDNKELISKLSDLSRRIGQANFDNEQIKAGQKEKAKIPELEKQMSELTGGPKIEDLEESLKSSGENAAELDKRIAGIDAVIDQNAAELDAFGDPKLKKGKVLCPIGLECPHDEKMLKKRKATLKGLATAKDGERKSVKQKLNAARQIHNRNDVALKKARHNSSEIHDLKSEIQRALEIKDGEPVDVDAIKAEKAEVEKELTRLSSISKPVASNPILDKLDAIVDSLNVHGIKTDVIRKEAKGLEDEVNAALAKFGDWKVQFFVEEDYQPTILTAKGECSLGELSDGERALLSLILQDVFAQRSGIGMVVMDNVDLLDRGACESFINTACRVKSKVLIAMANADHIQMGDGDPMKIVNLGPAKAAAPQERASKPKPKVEKPEAPKKGDEPGIEDLFEE